MASTDWIQGLKVAELKDELKKRDQPVAGKKAELAARLEEYIKEHEAGSVEEAPVKAAAEEETAGGAGSEEKAPSEGPEAIEAPEDGAAEPAVQEPKVAEPEPKAAEVTAAPAEAEARAVPAEDVDVDYGDSDDEQPQKQPAEKPATPAEPSKRQEEPETRKKAEPESRKRPTSDKPSPEAAPRPEKQAKTEEQKSKEQKQKEQEQAGKVETAATATEKAPEKAADKQERKPGSRALLIEGFVRPFTENQARTLLSQSGTVVAMWMPTIRNLAWVVYSTKSEAEAAKTALFKLQWPAGSPKVLMPRSVSIQAAEKAIGQGNGTADFKIERMEEDGPDDEPEFETHNDNIGTMKILAAIPSGGKGHPSGSRQHDDEILRDASPLRVKDLRELLSRKRDSGAGGATNRNVRDPGPNLDELFKKTSSKPAIYWLPLSDEAVELKKKAKAAAAGAEGSGGGGGGGSGYRRR